MLQYLYDVIIVPGSILVPITIAFINYKYLDKPLKTILIFNLITAGFNIPSIILGQYGVHTAFLFHIYAVFEFGCISLFYRQLFDGIIKKVIPFLIILFAIICLINFIFIQNGVELNTYTRAIESIIIIGYSVMFFNKQSLMEVKYKWADLSINWANTALLSFYSFGFFTFMITNHVLYAEKRVWQPVFNLYAFTVLVENVVFAVAFYKCRRQAIVLAQDNLSGY
jgi:hypothetical protein